MSTKFKEKPNLILQEMLHAIQENRLVSPEIAEQIHEAVDSLKQLNKEIITDCLKEMLTENKPISHVFIEFSDVISTIIPQIKQCIGFDHQNPYHKHNVYEHMLAVVDGCDTNSFNVKLAALLHDIGKPDKFEIGEDGFGHCPGHPERSAEIAADILANYLEVSEKDAVRILTLIEIHDNDIGYTQKNARKFLLNEGEDVYNDWIILRESDVEDHLFPYGRENELWTNIDVIRNNFNKALFEIKQDELIASLALSRREIFESQIVPPHEIKNLMNEMVKEWLNGNLNNEREALLNFAREYAQELNGPIINSPER